MNNFLLKIILITRKFIKIILIFFFYSECLGNDPVSSHGFTLNSFYNPANNIFQKSVNLSINYRNQLPALGNAYATYKVGFDGIVLKKNIGLGGIIARDVTGGGTFSTTSIDIYYSYLFKINRFTEFAFALQTSVYQTNIAYDGLSDLPGWVTNYQQVTGVNRTGYFPDFSLGIAGKIQNYGFSAGVFHLLQPQLYDQDPLSFLPRRYNFTTFYSFDLNSPFNKNNQTITPMFSIDIQGINKYITYGAVLKTTIFEPGLWVRSEPFSFKNSGIILSSKINFLNLYIVYSFDVLLTNSYLTFSNFGIHEVTLGCHIKYKERKYDKGTINCPYE